MQVVALRVIASHSAGSVPLNSLCVRSHISESLETSPDQFANAVGSAFQLMGNCFVTEADDPQVNGVLLAERELGQVVSHQLPLFLVQVDPLGIGVRTGMSQDQCIGVGLEILEVPPSRPEYIDGQIVSNSKQPVAGVFGVEIVRAAYQQTDERLLNNVLDFLSRQSPPPKRRA